LAGFWTAITDRRLISPSIFLMIGAGLLPRAVRRFQDPHRLIGRPMTLLLEKTGRQQQCIPADVRN
jgi:hypothetical protein